MIAYLDSTVLARAYLVDEDGHQQASGLLADPDIATVTGTWTRFEVSGALVRAARAGRGDEKGLLALLDGDLAGPVIVLGAPQDQVEQHALQLVRGHALRAMDAWHPGSRRNRRSAVVGARRGPGRSPRGTKHSAGSPKSLGLCRM